MTEMLTGDFMPREFSDYGTKYENLRLEAAVSDGSTLVMSGLVDTGLGHVVDVYELEGYEYKVISDDRG